MTISKNIKKEKFHPLDPLSNGIIYVSSLEYYHPRLFNILKKNGQLREIKRYHYNDYKVKLTEEDKDFIRKHIIHGYHSASQVRAETAKFQNALSSFLTQMEDIWTLQIYQKKSARINESSYSHQVVKPLFDFLLNGIENIGKENQNKPKQNKSIK